MNFEFNIDKKCTVWIRELHQLDAENYEQAKELILANFRESATDNTFVCQEIQYDTLEDLYVEKNNGWPTAELLNQEGDTIADNTI